MSPALTRRAPAAALCAAPLCAVAWADAPSQGAMGIALAHRPSRGTAPAVQDVVDQRLQAMPVAPGSTAGKARLEAEARVVIPATPQQMAANSAAEHSKRRVVIRTARIQPD